MNDFLKPNPIPPYLLHENSAPNCICCTNPNEYEDFLISEYGAEKVLQVKREERESDEYFKNCIKNRPDDMFAVALASVVWAFLKDNGDL